MKKRKNILCIFLVLSLAYATPIQGVSINNQEIETIEAESIMSENEQAEASLFSETPEINEIEIIEPTLQEIAHTEYLAHMEKLNTCKNYKEWFLEYKTLINKYSSELDEVETIYDCFSEAELQLLFHVVEAEVEGFGFEEKCNVASVIFNRLEHEGFGNTLFNVLIPGQFTTIRNGKYKRVTPSEDTILACEYCFIIEETANGAIYFEGAKSNVHQAYATLVEPKFEDHSGHKFYK